MAGFDDFDEQDWRETLSELRLMVAGAGFIDWDASAAAAIAEDDELHKHCKLQLQRYLRGFIGLLKLRSSYNLERLGDDLSRILRDSDGRPVRGAVLVSDDGQETDRDIMGGPTSDDLLAEVSRFADAVAGEGGYFDEPESKA